MRRQINITWRYLGNWEGDAVRQAGAGFWTGINGGNDIFRRIQVRLGENNSIRSRLHIPPGNSSCDWPRRQVNNMPDGIHWTPTSDFHAFVRNRDLVYWGAIENNTKCTENCLLCIFFTLRWMKASCSRPWRDLVEKCGKTDRRKIHGKANAWFNSLQILSKFLPNLRWLGKLEATHWPQKSKEYYK